MARAFERFLRGETSGPGWAVLRGTLVPAAFVYGAVAAMRSAAQRRAPDRLAIPVISVGNPTVGGTGKTPFVRMLARRLVARGERPLILSRGYGASAASGLDEEGESLRRDVPEASVAQDKDRFRAAAPFLRSDPKPTVAVLDDAAQALRFHRDLDIQLVDATRPFGAGWTLPAGALREPPRAVGRADLVVATRADGVPEALRARTRELLLRHGAPEPVLWSRHAPDRLLPEGDPPGTLAGQKVFLVSGIARPESFQATVAELGATVVGLRTHPDHHPYTAEDLAAVDRAARGAGADLILATGKDGPKLAALPAPGLPLHYLEVVVALEADGDEVLDAALERVLRTADDGG
ncbi:MAG: tetraacyldisaccharide 4'-kinase [Planctomycetes bacterium]|nr:tetraacyldisaccharide 4'-kinase [Planctomycetota bacterium]